MYKTLEDETLALCLIFTFGVVDADLFIRTQQYSHLLDMAVKTQYFKVIPKMSIYEDHKVFSRMERKNYFPR